MSSYYKRPDDLKARLSKLKQVTWDELSNCVDFPAMVIDGMKQLAREPNKVAPHFVILTLVNLVLEGSLDVALKEKKIDVDSWFIKTALLNEGFLEDSKSAPAPVSPSRPPTSLISTKSPAPLSNHSDNDLPHGYEDLFSLLEARRGTRISVLVGEQEFNSKAELSDKLRELQLGHEPTGSSKSISETGQAASICSTTILEYMFSDYTFGFHQAGTITNIRNAARASATSNWTETSLSEFLRVLEVSDYITKARTILSNGLCTSQLTSMGETSFQKKLLPFESVLEFLDNSTGSLPSPSARFSEAAEFVSMACATVQASFLRGKPDGLSLYGPATLEFKGKCDDPYRIRGDVLGQSIERVLMQAELSEYLSRVYSFAVGPSFAVLVAFHRYIDPSKKGSARPFEEQLNLIPLPCHFVWPIWLRLSMQMRVRGPAATYLTSDGPDLLRALRSIPWPSSSIAASVGQGSGSRSQCDSRSAGSEAEAEAAPDSSSTSAVVNASARELRSHKSKVVSRSGSGSGSSSSSRCSVAPTASSSSPSPHIDILYHDSMFAYLVSYCRVRWVGASLSPVYEVVLPSIMRKRKGSSSSSTSGTQLGIAIPAMQSMRFLSTQWNDDRFTVKLVRCKDGAHEFAVAKHVIERLEGLEVEDSKEGDREAWPIAAQAAVGADPAFRPGPQSLASRRAFAREFFLLGAVMLPSPPERSATPAPSQAPSQRPVADDQQSPQLHLRSSFVASLHFAASPVLQRLSAKLEKAAKKAGRPSSDFRSQPPWWHMGRLLAEDQDQADFIDRDCNARKCVIFMRSGSPTLSKHLWKFEPPKFDDTLCNSIRQQVLYSLKFLHSLDVLHTDLRIPNIMAFPVFKSKAAYSHSYSHSASPSVTPANSDRGLSSRSSLDLQPITVPFPVPSDSQHELHLFLQVIDLGFAAVASGSRSCSTPESAPTSSGLRNQLYCWLLPRSHISHHDRRDDESHSGSDSDSDSALSAIQFSIQSLSLTHPLSPGEYTVFPSNGSNRRSAMEKVKLYKDRLVKLTAASHAGVVQSPDENQADLTKLLERFGAWIWLEREDHEMAEVMLKDALSVTGRDSNNSPESGDRCLTRSPAAAGWNCS